MTHDAAVDMPPDNPWQDRIREPALTVLLVLEVLLLFVAAPLAGMGFQFPSIAAGLLIIPLILAIVAASRSNGARAVALLSVALAISGGAFRVEHPSAIADWLGHFAVIAALSAISIVVAQSVFAPGRVTHHRIQGAIVLYLNIAVAFTAAYRLTMELSPGALANLPTGQSEIGTASNVLYFSFATLTSTGFGDIVPIHPVARSLANLESLLGQLYPAILLARIVPLHIESRRR